MNHVVVLDDRSAISPKIGDIERRTSRLHIRTVFGIDNAFGDDKARVVAVRPIAQRNATRTDRHLKDGVVLTVDHRVAEAVAPQEARVVEGRAAGEVREVQRTTPDG